MCHINCNIPVGAAAVLSVTRLFTSHRFAVTVEVLDQISENKTKGKVKKVKRVKKNLFPSLAPKSIHKYSYAFRNLILTTQGSSMIKVQQIQMQPHITHMCTQLSSEERNPIDKREPINESRKRENKKKKKVGEKKEERAAHITCQ
ncbi:hypothetical protein, unlikely [Trypanosoma congolense IL3000]|uniref:Uncharacterized protein n=1 Tax=Trypanosoma congolense (strain IL3000) TaxID=1068625 RepID=F9W699_TRYCI|nr:hypothetical protein, unlikely [Trypanosoma congolense IL3000]